MVYRVTDEPKVTRYECGICKEGIRSAIEAETSKVSAEIKALRRELVIAVTVATTIISILISIKWW